MREDDDGEIRDDAPAPAAPVTPATPVAPAPPAPVDAAAIDYSRTQFYVTRRQWRLLVALTLFNTIALGWFVFAPNSSAYIKNQWQQWQLKRAETARLRQVAADQKQCLDFVMPSEQLIYEEDPAAALKLTSAKAGYSPVRMQVNHMLATTAAWASPAQAVGVPDCWTTFARSGDIENSLGCSADLPVLFLGRRTVAGSNETMLVVVQFESRPTLDAREPERDMWRMSAARRLIVSTFRPSTSSQRPRRMGTDTLNLFLPPTSAQVNGAGDAWVITEPVLMAILSGKADPKDPSHFTLPYKVNGHGGVIDGWLHAEGVVLRPQSGTAVNFGGGQRAWNLAVPPATQPGQWHRPLGSDR